MSNLLNRGMPQDASHRQYAGMYAFAREITESTLAEERTPERLYKLVGKLERLSEKEINSIHSKISALGDEGKGILPACSKGCWHCCTHVVGASVPEILEAARYIKETWSAEEIAELIVRIEAHRRQTVRFRTGEGNYPPRALCPLLKDSSCSVWLNRPLICRGWNSVSVEDCIVKRENPESGVRERGVAAQFAVSDNVREGLLDGLKSLGYRGEVCELAAGLGIAMSVPDAAERYLAGDDLFVAAEEGMDKW